MPLLRAKHSASILFLALLALSAVVKLHAAQLLAWEADYVPLIARGQAWLAGGDFPVVGTLSSVAAYNMPFLVWLQLPALLITRDVPTVLIGTQLAFNLLATWILFRLGGRLFSPGAGLIAAALFTLSDTGISSAYTAWAQLLLPGFYIAFAYCLYRWKTEGRGWQAALTWIVATAAFMTHFSAILLFAVLLVLGLLWRLPLPRKGLALGIVISALMLVPYLTFEARHNFVDLRAFFSQRHRISSAVLAEYAYLKPEAGTTAAQAPANRDADAAPTPPDAPATEPRILRGLRWLATIPWQLIASLRLAFQGDLANLRDFQPTLYALSNWLRVLLEACFWLGFGHALLQFSRVWLTCFRALPSERGRWRQGWQFARDGLAANAAGRNLFLLLITLGIAGGLILARAGPQQQPSYYTGLISLQFLMCSYAILAPKRQRHWRNLLLVFIVIYIGLTPIDRFVRVSQQDRAAHTPLNLGLYRNINEAAGWIAADWGEAGALTVGYDLFPEMAYQWWVVAWNTVDESYRIGMALDFLLESNFGLRNRNLNPAGSAERPHYIVTSAPGVLRYDLANYEQAQFGALYVLKPIAA